MEHTANCVSVSTRETRAALGALCKCSLYSALCACRNKTRNYTVRADVICIWCSISRFRNGHERLQKRDATRSNVSAQDTTVINNFRQREQKEAVDFGLFFLVGPEIRWCPGAPASLLREHLFRQAKPLRGKVSQHGLSKNNESRQLLTDIPYFIKRDTFDLTQYASREVMSVITIDYFTCFFSYHKCKSLAGPFGLRPSVWQASQGGHEWHTGQWH